MILFPRLADLRRRCCRKAKANIVMSAWRKTLPGSPFEVIEAEFLFHLLMGLLANPPCLDGSSQSAQIGRSRQIGEVVLPLSRQATSQTSSQTLRTKPGLKGRTCWPKHASLHRHAIASDTVTGLAARIWLIDVLI